jgi:hypothetical protein
MPTDYPDRFTWAELANAQPCGPQLAVHMDDALWVERAARGTARTL